MKKFVSVMNGTVSIDSQPGQGTTLCIKLPVENSEEYQETTDITEFKAQATNIENSATILLVEDNEQILKYLAGTST